MTKKKPPVKKTEKQKVEERREEVLANGRKFKYPLQYAKHKTILYTIIIAILAVVAMSGLTYFSLYKAQSTNEILYRITTILPLPVAKIDNEPVRYSDYLMIYKSTITPVEQQQGKLSNDSDSDAMRAHYKRSALTDAENYTYALRFARENGITVSDEDIDKAIADHRKVGGVERSEESFTKILQDNFSLSMDEYRRMIYLSLIKTKVSEAIDDAAIQLSEEVAAKLTSTDMDFQEVAKEFGEKVLYEETGGLVDIMNVDGGRSSVAVQLEPGQVSPGFISNNGDGYYFVKLIEKTDKSVNYVSIKVPLNAFKEKLASLRASGSVQEYITLAEDSNQ